MTPPSATHQTSPEKWLFSQARQSAGLLYRSIACGATAGLLVLLQAWLLARICQRGIFEHAGTADLLPLGAGLAVTALCRALLSYFSERSTIDAAAAIKQRLRSQLYRRLVSVGGGNGDNAAMIEAVTSGIDGLESYITRFIPHLALAAILPVFAHGFVLPTDWRCALVLLFSAPFIPLFMILIGRGSERLNQRQWKRLTRLSGYLLDLIQGLPDLKIFGAVRREAALLADISDEYRQATMSVLRIAFLSAFTLEFFATVGTAVIAVIVGFSLLNNQLTLGEGLFILILAPEFYLPLRTLGLSYHSRMQGISAAAQILPLFNAPHPCGFDGTLPPPDTAPHIVFEDVSYDYQGGRGGVRNISLTIGAGEIAALTGESGAGKTTIARLLAGLARADSGRILVNDQELNRITPSGWHAAIAWVPQQPFFFKGTIRENLLSGLDNISEDAIREALRKCACLPFIDRLPNGLDHVMAEGGRSLSGGELRRLALARALLRKARLLILDEPTAALDAENERILTSVITQLAGSSTILLISHREATIANVNQTIKITAGRLEPIVASSPLKSHGVPA